jgi:drug/metabolite transporter (DMT)-like permease
MSLGSMSGCRIISLFAIYATASVSMTLLNKSISASGFSAPFFVILIQNACAVISSCLLFWLDPRLIKTPKREHHIHVIMNTFLFIIGLWSSLKSLEFVSIPIYVVATNGRPLCSALLEFLIQGSRPSWVRLCGLCLIMCGAAVAVISQSSSEFRGLFYAFLNTFLIGLLGVYENMIMKQVREEQTPFGINLYRLTLSVPLLTCLMAVSGERPQWFDESLLFLSVSGFFCLFLGVIVFTLQRETTATNIQVASNLFKFITTVISLFTHPAETSTGEWIGYTICFSGFLMYSFNK